MTVQKKTKKAEADWKATQPPVPASFRRMVATIRIPSIAEAKALEAAAEDCLVILEGTRGR